MNFNSLGTALALAGVADAAEASSRPAAWQTRPQTGRDRFRARLWAAEAHAGHRLSREAGGERRKSKESGGGVRMGPQPRRRR